MIAPRYDTVSFLSDYGLRDEFVGIVKGVIADIAPHARVIDLTHEVPPFDVRAGSLALARCISYVPSGVVLAVVDPGVGTARRGIAVSVGGGRGVLIGPDNGLLSMGTALAGGANAAVVLNNPKYRLEAPVPPSPGETFLPLPPRTSATESHSENWATQSTRISCCQGSFRCRVPRATPWSPRSPGSIDTETAS